MVSKLYIRENILLGGASFFFGLILGVLLQQVLLSIMYSMVRMEYHLHIAFHAGTILMTVLCYAGCYWIALFRCRRKFKKMNIHALMNANRQNEEIKEKHEDEKTAFSPFYFLYLPILDCLWKDFQCRRNFSVFDWTGTYDLSFLCGAFSVDYLLCA